jgi:putative transposase
MGDDFGWKTMAAVKRISVSHGRASHIQVQASLSLRCLTDKLRSYGAARRQVMPHVEHRSHKVLYNRAENSHVPLRKRERIMQGFRSPGGLQRFVSVFSALRNLFVPPRSQRSAFQNRVHRIHAIAEWKAAAEAMA